MLDYTLLNEPTKLLERLAELEHAVMQLDCEGEWCGKSPTTLHSSIVLDNGKCAVCNLQATIKGG